VTRYLGRHLVLWAEGGPTPPVPASILCRLLASKHVYLCLRCPLFQLLLRNVSGLVGELAQRILEGSLRLKVNESLVSGRLQFGADAHVKAECESAGRLSRLINRLAFTEHRAPSYCVLNIPYSCSCWMTGHCPCSSMPQGTCNQGDRSSFLF
jgi:hypothetical protein